MEWQGSGYIVLDRETLAGSYMIEGGLNGGNCGIEVGIAYLVNLILTFVDILEVMGLLVIVIDLLAICSPIIAIPGALVAGVIGYYLVRSIALTYYANILLIDRYVDGDEAAWEQVKINLAVSAAITVGGWAFSALLYHVAGRYAAEWLKQSMGGELAERTLKALDGDSRTAAKVYKSLQKAGLGDDLIAELVETVGKEGVSRLQALAARGMSGELLEVLARNKELFQKFTATDLLAFKNTSLSAAEILEFLKGADLDGITLYRAYGDETVAIWKAMGTEGLEGLRRYGLDFIGVFRRHWDEFLEIYGKQGLGFLDKYLAYGEEVFTYYARYGDDYLEILMNYGDEAVQGIRNFGDEFIEQWRNRGKKFLEDFLDRGEAALKSSVDLKTNRIPDNDSVISHIFRDAEGHILDTPENRALLEEVANNTDNFRGNDKYGNEWYTMELEDGRQVWVESRDGNIFDGGINETPKFWNPETGLKKP